MKFTLIFVFLLSVFFKAYSKDSTSVIHVGYYIKALKMNNKDENADIDFYYWYHFKLPKDTSDMKSIYNLEFVNGDISSNEIQEERIIGNEYYLTGRIKGTFRFSSDFTSYPFDKQKLLIQLEHAVLTDDQIIVVPDTISYIRSKKDKTLWGVSSELDSKDVILSKTEFIKDSRVYETDFGDTELEPVSSYSRLSFYIHVKRNAVPYTLKFMMPLVIILSLAYLVFFIPAEDMELACGLTVTSLLAAIAFQWTVSDDLPNVGYLTCVDKIFYLGYSLIMLAMVQTVWTYHLEKDGKEKLANILEISGRWLFPIIFFGGAIIFINNSLKC
jgi:hypothetical protein